jgi:hypothetical protein
MFLASSLVGALPQRAPSLLLATRSRGSGAVPPPQAGEGWDISACGLLGFASRKGKMKVGWRVVEACTHIYKVGTSPHPSLLLAGGGGNLPDSSMPPEGRDAPPLSRLRGRVAATAAGRGPLTGLW